MKKGNILLLIIIVLVVLAICIIGVLVSMKHQENMLLYEDEGIIDREIVKSLTEVTSRNNFYIVQSCVEKFYTYYSEIFDDEYEGYLINTDEDKAKIKAKRVDKLYKMLDEEYIEHEGITLENLTSKLSEIEYTSILINNMYYVEKDERVSEYLVYGSRSGGTVNSKATDFSIMVKVDAKNRTFKVLLGELVDNYYKALEMGQELKIKEDEIKDDTYNTFSYEHISESEYINDLFAHYKKSIRFNREQSYNLLDENYKKICFEDLEDYLSYLDSNYSRISSSRLEEYNKEDNSSYTEYLFKDKKGNYYIFKETAPFKYTVILDNYTIPTQDFKEEYNSLTEAKKVILNIKNFFKGIDDKNYGYSYSVLSETFKNNKYPTKSEFVNYVKQNFFEKNEIEYASYEKENGLFIYKIRLTDATGKDTAEKEFNMIVKLNSGTDFEMSFGTD